MGSVLKTARSYRTFNPTGIAALKDSLPNATAVFCCAGTSMQHYDDTIAPSDWPRFAVNGGIKNLNDNADYWALADAPIVHEYMAWCLEITIVLAMHEAGPLCKRLMSNPDHVYTVDSTNEPILYDDGKSFFSRGTVLIGALGMARYMGVRRAFVFGLDCYRTRAAYYYDGRRPTVATEAKPTREDEIEGGLLVTPRLRRMIEKLDEARAAGLWNDMEIWCVGSPRSKQKAIPLMTIEEFTKIAEREKA